MRKLEAYVEEMASGDTISTINIQKVQDDVLKLHAVEPMCSDAKEREDIRRRPTINADVNAPGELLVESQTHASTERKWGMSNGRIAQKSSAFER